jgi:hypothetical protein
MNKSVDSYTKADWMEVNTHGGLSLNADICRVFRVDFLLKDIGDGTNTLVHPCYETQKDDLENPLKVAGVSFDGKRQELFRGLMGEYYSQSWSLKPMPWGIFGEGKDTIRVRCKAGALFDRLIDENDPFYGLYYHMGKITYQDAQEIRDAVAKSDFHDFLDSQGYGLLKTVLKIRSDYKKEEEVRLVYCRSPRKGYAYPGRHRVSGDQNQFCSHLFDWRRLIKDYELNPGNRNPGDEIARAIGDLNKS